MTRLLTIKKSGSVERDTLATAALTVNATGNTIPLFLVFPKDRFQSNFIRDSLTTCHGDANFSGFIRANL